METVTIEIDEQVLKKMGKKRIKNYIDRMISLEQIEDFTKTFKDKINLTEEEYQQKLEDIRQTPWDRYKKDLPIK
ncbi:MAG: hypothetical protein JSV88_12180 [Candidatus Aminicenantes bacterium]|nr:MAG: hypothetical protein JSV88_12180 [Candidatus Aminicenantes bacterium]